MRPLDRIERRRMDRLRRRCHWLETRIASTPKAEVDGSFDKGELSALRWAIQFIESHSEPSI